MRYLGYGSLLGLFLVVGATANGESTEEALARLKAVGREGAGNAAAARAWKDVVREGPAALPAILQAMDDADATAANWLRTAGDCIAERALAAGQALPADKLEQFLANTRHNVAARRLAYEWLCRIDPKTPDRLLPGMIQDPSPELRRDAVAAQIKQAQTLFDKNDKDGARAAYRKALSGACDKDQVDQIVAQLEKLGVNVDVAAHFGFVRQWLLVAPFDNRKDAGFNVAYPPEKGVDPSAVYKGKDGTTARWVAHTTNDRYGVVDLNKVLGKQQGVVGYAYAVIESPAERAIQIRVGSQNAVKIFLNGKELYHRDEYHHGADIDQHVARATLKPGRNELLLKICQNEQTDDWAQAWIFQARLCDAVGAAVPYTTLALKPMPKPGEAKP